MGRHRRARRRSAARTNGPAVLSSIRSARNGRMRPSSEEVDIYGERWQNGFTVFALIAHQAHHRGQMTVFMRQAGLRVPGVYGPAREEWATMGMAAME